MSLNRLARLAWANPYLLLALTTLLWGGNTVVTRLAVGNISPMALSSLRWMGVALVFPLVLRQELVKHWPVIRANALQICLMGGLGFTAFNALMYVAGHHTTAINIGIIQGSIPALVILAVWMLFGVRMSGMQILGLLLTLLGVVLITLRGNFMALRQLEFNIGDLLMIVACVFYAGYTVALRNRPPLPSLVLFTCFAVVACGFSLLLLSTETVLGQLLWPNWQGWLIVLFVTLGPSIAAQIMFIRGVELIGPSRAGLFVNLIPIWAAVLGIFILGEPFGAYHAAALACVLGGIAIAEQGRTG